MSSQTAVRGVNELRRGFVDACTLHSSATALVDGAGSLTYRELRREVAQVAAAIAGVSATGAVGVHLPRCRRHVISVIAAACDGRTYVPLPPDYPDERLAHFLTTAGVDVVVTDRDGLARAKRVFGGTSVVCLDDALPAAAASDLAPPGGSSAIAYVMFTSGSTGTPKGVAVPHRAVANLVEAGRTFARLDQRPVVAHLSNPAFDVSTFEIWGPLLTGGTVAVIENPNPLTWGPLLLGVAADRATVMLMTTSIFNQIARIKPKSLHGIGTILFGGEVAAADIIRSFVKSGFDGTLMNMYGPTEATTISTGWEVGDDWVRGDFDVVPVGVAIAGAVVGLRDEHGSAVEGTSVGEVVIGGVGVADGYVGDHALTAERFTSDPAGMIDGTIYWTGDLGRWHDAGQRSLVIVGRSDRQTKIRGFRVEPGEIEATLRNHRSVLEAAVVAVGEGASQRLAALVVVCDGTPTTEAEIAHAVGRRLPSSMIPKQIKLVDRLPLTHNGKTDYAKIEELFTRG